MLEDKNKLDTTEIMRCSKIIKDNITCYIKYVLPPFRDRDLQVPYILLITK